MLVRDAMTRGAETISPGATGPNSYVAAWTTPLSASLGAFAVCADTFTTNASRSPPVPPPPYRVWNAPAVTGKSRDVVNPATYTFPSLSTAIRFP